MCMKTRPLIDDIKKGWYDIDEGIIKLPKAMVLELLKEVHMRRKVMSLPKKAIQEKHTAQFKGMDND